MTREPDFNELVGADLPPEEEARLRRAHELLVAAGPVPELPPGLEEPNAGERRSRLNENGYQLLPRRRVAAAPGRAAATPLIAIVGGYIAGLRHDRFTARYCTPMLSATGSAAS